MKAHRCGECGSSQLEWQTDTEVVCLYCETRYRKVPKAEPKVVIRDGANVVFGPNSNVVVRGGMEIEDGANVRFEGDIAFELEIIELGKAARESTND